MPAPVTTIPEEPPMTPDTPARGQLDSRREDGVLRLTKRHPTANDGLDLTLMAALETAIAEAATDASLRAVVVDSAGGFHAGAVLVTELAPDPSSLGPEDFRALVRRGHALGRAIAALTIPVIGIARRGALGGGLELLLRSDFLYCTDHARFSYPEVTLGLVAAWGGTQFTSRLVPMRKAQEMLLLGEAIDGRQAEAWGLVTRSFSDDAALDAHVAAVLQRLRVCSPASMRWTKRCLQAVWNGGLAHGEQVEEQAETEAMASGDFLKALPALAAGQRWDFVAGEAVARKR